MGFPYLSQFRLFMVALIIESSFTNAVTSSTLTPCSVLSSLLPNKVSYPGNAIYTSSVLSYFFQEARLEPACIVSPTSAADVSLIVRTMREGQSAGSARVPYAVRSGGHTPFAGAANTNGGVTIDLRAMDSVNVSSNRTITSVGAGSIWENVYEKIQPMNLTVLGARVAGLGVGGFLTGGGISFFSPERGFACDNVANIEVVLANSTVVNANARENSDLFTALKGGSNNFGIVTRFDLQTYSQGNFLGGFIFYPGSTVKQQLLAFENFMAPQNFDPYAEVVLAVGYEGATGSYLVSSGIFYTKPILNPPVLREFTSIQPQLSNTLRISNISDFVTEEENQQAVNSSGIYVTTTFGPSEPLFQEIYSIWNSTVAQVQAVAGIQHFLIFQRVPAVIPGNSVGLEASEGPLVLCLLSITWNSSEDDALINSVATSLIGRIVAATKAAGLFNKYQYLNYAAKFQQPIFSYGNASNAELRRVSKKYDPTGLFQTVVSGGFKLSK